MQTLTQDELARELTTKYVLDDQSSNGLMPSSRILAEEYGVSRLFLREVLAGMQRQGLIKSVPGKGVFIRKPHMLDTAKNVHTTLRQSAATARDLIEARVNLEEQTVYLAAMRATDDDIAQMEMALSAFDNATELLPRAESDIAFHSLIAKATQNPVLQIVFGSITTLTFEIMLRSLADSEVFAQGAPLHHKILSAIKDKDPDKAVAAMSKHLHIAEDTFDTDYDVALSVLADRVIQQTFGGSLTIHEILDSAFKNYSLDILR
jgi:GntR family transcriptional repressor for pyruvate dehydrogenase complex